MICKSCRHPAHMGLCTARSGGTAYACSCSTVTLPESDSPPRAPKALDLFCKAGGAAVGLNAAGFRVVGVDIEPQPNYPYKFHQRDALAVLAGAPLAEFDLIWASPPCQMFTAYRRKNRATIGHTAPNLIPEVRAALVRAGRPFVIENVPGAPLENPVTLCGSMFGLGVRRHRCFEAHGFTIAQLPCQHAKQRGSYPQATNRKNRRKTCEIGVWRIPLATQREAMGIGWMTLEELSEAVPPAFAKHVGESFWRTAT